MTKALARMGIALAAGVFLAACAGTGGGPVEQTVEERAQERWDLMVERDFEAAWALYTPGFRSQTDSRDFANDMNRRPIRWLGAEVRPDSDCDGDRCRVVVDVTYQPIAAPAGQGRLRMTRPLEETWIRLDGQWWFVQN
ncbi:MAG: hypothetical protein ACXIUB_11890 [Wenzhouxiangella sp.]